MIAFRRLPRTLGAVAATMIFWSDPALAYEASVSDGGVSGYTIADITPRFELFDTSGERVTETVFRDRWTLLFAGYTNCIEICPIALFSMGDVQRALGEAASLHLVFVDFDAGEVGIEGLAARTEKVDGDVLALTGSRKEIHAFGRDFKVRRMRRTPKAGEVGKQYHHTARFYLVGPDGKIAGLLNPEADPQALARAIKGHMDDAAAAPPLERQ